jgi:hypothetical protein
VCVSVDVAGSSALLDKPAVAPITLPRVKQCMALRADGHMRRVAIGPPDLLSLAMLAVDRLRTATAKFFQKFNST